MFKIYDLNYNEVNFPVDSLGLGLKALDIEIGSIQYNSIYSESSNTDTLVKRYPKDREVSIQAMFTAYDTADYRLKRDRVYAFFRNLGVFYVAESHQPFKLLKVIVDEAYMPERPVIHWGMLDIPLKVLGTPFKQSIHTTLDIDNEGLLFNDKWAYGMGLSANENQWKYSFSNENPRFYNAGTEEIKLIRQKESEIKLTFKGPTVNGLLDIDDSSTTFKIWEDFKAGDVLIIKGDKVTLNGNNVLGETNFEFLTVKKGWNDWDIRGLNGQFDFDIDFRFLYD